jgi:hypothetical protein
MALGQQQGNAEVDLAAAGQPKKNPAGPNRRPLVGHGTAKIMMRFLPRLSSPVFLFLSPHRFAGRVLRLEPIR